MSQTLTLKENQATYTVAVEKSDLTQQPIILKQNGQEVAVIISIEKYRAYEAWERQQLQTLQPENPSGSYPEFEADKAAFERMAPELMRDYQGRYVAIRGEEMVDSDVDKMTLIARVYQRFGYGPMYVQQVGKPLNKARIISPRIVKHDSL